MSSVDTFVKRLHRRLKRESRAVADRVRYYNRCTYSTRLKASKLMRFVCISDYFEDLLRPVQGCYKCIMFRAGAYCLEPSAGVVRDLRQAGFRCDSSVAKGLYSPGFYDFRAAPSNVLPWWTGTTGVTEVGSPGGLIELPILTVSKWESPIFRRLSGYMYTRRPSRSEIRWQERRRAWCRSQYPPQSRPKPLPAILPGGRRQRRVTQAILRHTPVLFDYDGLPASVFVDLLEGLLTCDELRSRVDAMEQSLGHEITVPVMASGHTKVMMDCANLRSILENIRCRLSGRVRYLTAVEGIDSAMTLLPLMKARESVAQAA